MIYNCSRHPMSSDQLEALKLFDLAPVSPPLNIFFEDAKQLASILNEKRQCVLIAPWEYLLDMLIDNLLEPYVSLYFFKVDEQARQRGRYAIRGVYRYTYKRNGDWSREFKPCVPQVEVGMVTGEEYPYQSE